MSLYIGNGYSLKYIIGLKNLNYMSFFNTSAIGQMHQMLCFVINETFNYK